jgi:hypothetical protein
MSNIELLEKKALLAFKPPKKLTLSAGDSDEVSQGWLLKDLEPCDRISHPPGSSANHAGAADD